MRKTLLFALTSAALFAQAPAPKTDPFAPLRFLIGHWVGEGSGQPGQGAGGFSFQPALDGKILFRHNVTEIEAKDGRPAAHHEDELSVYPEGATLRALYLDNEGHVIHYTVTALAGAQGAVLVSDLNPGPRFRLSYRSTGADTVSIRFEFAPPGKPEAFATYLEGSARRKPASH
jgi:hypothetical protein